MNAYRLTRNKYSEDLAGTGGLYAANRCNRKGTPVIYAAEHRSLSLVETLVHLDFEDVPLDYVLVTIEVPHTVETRQATPEEAFAVSSDPPVSVFLVHSVIVPQEFNVVMYPRHPAFEAHVTNIEPFRIDPRLMGIR